MGRSIVFDVLVGPCMKSLVCLMFWIPWKGLDIQLAQSRPSLHQYLMRKNDNTFTTCTLANYPIQDPNICQKTYTIYYLICLKCHNFYIGSTIRPLHIRIKEYLNTHASSFHKHLIKWKNNNFSIKIETVSKVGDLSRGQPEGSFFQ